MKTVRTVSSSLSVRPFQYYTCSKGAGWWQTIEPHSEPCILRAVLLWPAYLLAQPGKPEDDPGPGVVELIVQELLKEKASADAATCARVRRSRQARSLQVGLSSSGEQAGLWERSYW